MAISKLGDSTTELGQETYYQIQAGDTLTLALQDDSGSTVVAPINVAIDPGTGTTIAVSVQLSNYSSAAWVPVPQYDAVTGSVGLPLNAPFARIRFVATGGTGNSTIEVVSPVAKVVRITA